MKKLTIYIVKHRPSTKHSAESKPCSHCAKEIKRLGIKKIVYCNVHGEVQKENMSDFNSNFLSSGYREYARKNIDLC